MTRPNRFPPRRKTRFIRGTSSTSNIWCKSHVVHIMFSDDPEATINKPGGRRRRRRTAWVWTSRGDQSCQSLRESLGLGSSKRSTGTHTPPHVWNVSTCQNNNNDEDDEIVLTFCEMNWRVWLSHLFWQLTQTCWSEMYPWLMNGSGPFPLSAVSIFY